MSVGIVKHCVFVTREHTLFVKRIKNSTNQRYLKTTQH